MVYLHCYPRKRELIQWPKKSLAEVPVNAGSIGFLLSNARCETSITHPSTCGTRKTGHNIDLITSGSAEN